MVYEVALTKPLSTVLVAEAGSCTGVDPLLSILVTVYPVTAGLLADNTGGVHVTVMDESEVALAVTLGGGGTGQSQSRIIIDITRPHRDHTLCVRRLCRPSYVKLSLFMSLSGYGCGSFANSFRRLWPLTI